MSGTSRRAAGAPVDRDPARRVGLHPHEVAVDRDLRRFPPGVHGVVENRDTGQLAVSGDVVHHHLEPTVVLGGVGEAGAVRLEARDPIAHRHVDRGAFSGGRDQGVVRVAVIGVGGSAASDHDPGGRVVERLDRLVPSDQLVAEVEVAADRESALGGERLCRVRRVDLVVGPEPVCARGPSDHDHGGHGGDGGDPGPATAPAQPTAASQDRPGRGGRDVECRSFLAQQHAQSLSHGGLPSPGGRPRRRAARAA